MDKRNPRYMQAETAIRTAFLALFEQESIDDITTSEIIRASGVNRSTFYAHYTDKFDLLDKVEGDFLSQLGDILRDSPTLSLLLGERSERLALEEHFNRLVDFLHGNKRLFAGFVRCESSDFKCRFSETLKDVLIERGADSKLQMPMGYATVSSAWATAGLVSEWARRGFEDSKGEFVRMLVDVTMSIQQAVLG